ncbi:RluA family pseudouridine synthase [Aquibacillus koreensis]|uniref:Pseudouridine synthase n=1 Tax=Aquibacillus koreensis TaxID=279446 RepID=A0A9X4AGC4_9BACI|nr:RluA family pseudouridine synthase [Aquibacillus koreensis]MCT2537481.1 RluA family pseudouridine synthase [Aquibacillus koreensis]MDC3418927.1 RluA family pseudouridine synthase [Aquibacillus koreensis]
MKKKFTNTKQPTNTLEYSVQNESELLPFLLEVLSSKSRNKVKSMLTRGQVSVEDKTITAHNYKLLPGFTVSIQKNKAAKITDFTGLTILYEDQDVIVIDKQAGLLTVATDKEKEMTAYRQLMDYVRQKQPKNRIFIVHRLDRDTSGVMMFAKNEKVKQLLQNAWKEKVKDRIYIALVEGAITKQEGTINSWLKQSKTLKMLSSNKPNGGQQAVTRYKVLQSNKSRTLLEVQLETGRKNQIRVHMESIGHPIVGDKKYGAKENDIGRLGLHAKVLSFEHPTTGKTLQFESKVPKAFLKPF